MCVCDPEMPPGLWWVHPGARPAEDSALTVLPGVVPLDGLTSLRQVPVIVQWEQLSKTPRRGSLTCVGYVCYLAFGKAHHCCDF